MNQPPKGLQDVLHSLESGAGRWLMRILLTALFGTAVTALYLFTEARNFSNPEAMEMATVGRNLATGRGYTTHFIRPLSLRYLQERAVELGKPRTGLLQTGHPDLQNPPVYPVLLAAVFKVLPDRLRYGLPADPLRNRPLPEQVITAFNLGWFALGVGLLYRLGKRLFDPEVGGLAAAVYAGSELFWRFSSNGLATPLLVVVVIVVIELLTRLDDTGSELAPGVIPPLAAPLRLSALLGLVIGVGFLTRYAFGWLLLPVLVWLMVNHVRRWSTVATCSLVFLLVAAPWLGRNYHLSGHLLGTAGSALIEGTEAAPENLAQRRLQKPKDNPDVTEIRVKLAVNLAETFRQAVPRIAGSWMTFLFFASLLLPLRNAGLRRLRWFTLGSLALFAVVQALFRTENSHLVAEVNPENQLVLLTPAMFLLGSALFYSLIDGTEFGHPLFRSIFVGGICVIFSLPLLSSLLPPRTYPLIEPAYRPDIIREIADYTRRDELLMSDIPWAVGWYGDRDCMWIPIQVQDASGDDFYAIHDFERRIAALYLSPFTAEAPLRLVGSGNHAWGRFYFDALMRRNLPKGFPLSHAYSGSAANGHLFLADRARWE
jgi:hypothetical protein